MSAIGENSITDEDINKLSVECCGNQWDYLRRKNAVLPQIVKLMKII